MEVHSPQFLGISRILRDILEIIKHIRAAERERARKVERLPKENESICVFNSFLILFTIFPFKYIDWIIGTFQPFHHLNREKKNWFHSKKAQKAEKFSSIFLKW